MPLISISFSMSVLSTNRIDLIRFIAMLRRHWGIDSSLWLWLWLWLCDWLRHLWNWIENRTVKCPQKPEAIKRRLLLCGARSETATTKMQSKYAWKYIYSIMYIISTFSKQTEFVFYLHFFLFSRHTRVSSTSFASCILQFDPIIFSHSVTWSMPWNCTDGTPIPGGGIEWELVSACVWLMRSARAVAVAVEPQVTLQTWFTATVWFSAAVTLKPYAQLVLQLLRYI